MEDKTKKSKKKIVSVKKLSRFYKKTYTTDSFEKKILQKLFIESDKILNYLSQKKIKIIIML